MGLLILERKDFATKYEEGRLSSETTEVSHMRDRAALSSALAEARKREDNLKKALGVEKECVANVSVLHKSVFLVHINISIVSLTTIYTNDFRLFVAD